MVVLNSESLMNAQRKKQTIKFIVDSVYDFALVGSWSLWNEPIHVGTDRNNRIMNRGSVVRKRSIGHNVVEEKLFFSPAAKNPTQKASL